MRMWENDRQPLPDWIEDAYRILLGHIDDPREGIERERAHNVLIHAQEFPDQPGDAEYAISRLLNRGYFYEVDGDLRVTEPDTTEE